MNEETRKQIEQLAALMLEMDYEGIVNNGMEEIIHTCIEENYGISFDNFCRLVWDLMDWTPVLDNPMSKPAHVLGAMIDSTTGRSGFLAIVKKEER